MASEGDDFEIEDEYEEEAEFDDDGEDDEQIVDVDEDEGHMAQGQGPIELPPNMTQQQLLERLMLNFQGQPGGIQQRGPRLAKIDEAEWRSLGNFPKPTQKRFLELLKSLQARDHGMLTILFLGKGGTGSSSTINSILGERAASVASSEMLVDTFIRNSQGFSLKLLDTPPLIAGDTFSNQAVQSILGAVQQHKVDVIVYVDRLDGYRVSHEDHRVLRGITEALGPEVWAQSVICLTHGSSPAPEDVSYDEYLGNRTEQLRKAVRQSGSKGPDPSFVAIENARGCQSDNDKQKILPNGTVWLTDLMGKVVHCAMDHQPYQWSPAVERTTDPNKRRRWLIIPILLAQIVLKKFVFDRVLEDDGAIGDQYGPFEPETIAENRDALRRRREAAKRRKQRQRVEAPASRASVRRVPVIEDSEDEDDLSD